VDNFFTWGLSVNYVTQKITFQNPCHPFFEVNFLCVRGVKNSQTPIFLERDLIYERVLIKAPTSLI
jgi:hypothetical protein